MPRQVGSVSNLYFAYGSNMSSTRMRSRVPTALVHGRARLEGVRLTFDKPGRDGSGKANLVGDVESEAWGVLYEIRTADWALLDRYEPGYGRVTRPTFVEDRGEVSAQLYLFRAELESGATEPALPPLEEYLAHLLEGAREHALPTHYAEYIRAAAR